MTTMVMQFFDASSGILEKGDIQVKEKKKLNEDRILLCRNCKHQIANESDRIFINESHSHTCKNPSGFIFTFGCFSDASGCISTGTASYEFSWFAGHSWQIVICANCGIHLGWLFRNTSQFYALITNRLISQ